MLIDWIFDPAGRSWPRGVPARSRMNTGTSTVLPAAATVLMVIASCAAAGRTVRIERTATANSVLRHCFGVIERDPWGLHESTAHVRREAARATVHLGAKEPRTGDGKHGGEHEQGQMRHCRNARYHGDGAIDQDQPGVGGGFNRCGSARLVRELR